MTHETDGPFGLVPPPSFGGESGLTLSSIYRSTGWRLGAEAQRTHDMRAFADTLAKEQLDDDTWEGWLHEAEKWMRWKMRELGIEPEETRKELSDGRENTR